MIMDTKPFFRKNRFNYGMFLYLNFLEVLENEEEFEICNDLIEVIKETNDSFDFDIPTTKNKYAIELFRDAFKTSENKGEVALANMPYYMDMIKKDLLNYVNSIVDDK